MRVLYLLRHARPIPPDRARSDFDRPLSTAGRIDAAKVSHVLSTEGVTRPFVISSPANRARETTEIVIASHGWSPNYESRIYEAELDTLIALISQIEDVYEDAILIGHNPGMESLLRYFTGELRAMPTAGLAKVVLEIDAWRGCANANTQVEWLVSP